MVLLEQPLVSEYLMKISNNYIKNKGECFLVGSKHQETDEITRPYAE